jgi:hypothetical protein
VITNVGRVKDQLKILAGNALFAPPSLVQFEYFHREQRLDSWVRTFTFRSSNEG